MRENKASIRDIVINFHSFNKTSPTITEVRFYIPRAKQDRIVSVMMTICRMSMIVAMFSFEQLHVWRVLLPTLRQSGEAVKKYHEDRPIKIILNRSSRK
jgi:hypothetical protein